MLAIRILQEQGVEVEALNFKTIFTCCQDQSAQAARQLGVRLTIVGQEDDYLELVRRPRHGYGKGANPCVDCRIYMFEKARRFMQQVDAQFVISGEVVGQRPMSQKRTDLELISDRSDLDGLLLRPLSAKLLPPTRPELDGLVDRDRLYDFSGRSRAGLIALANQFGFPDIPNPSNGCALTEVLFAKKVHDLIALNPAPRRWDYELLKLGRHYRFDERTKVVVGRREAENELLRRVGDEADASPCTMLLPEQFQGPTTILVGPVSDAALAFAGGLVVRHSKTSPGESLVVRVVQQDGRSWLQPVKSSPASEAAVTLANA